MKAFCINLLALALMAFLAGPALALDWTQEAFSEDEWIYDRAEFGYGDGDETTELSSGRSTYYFRYSFNAEALEDAGHMTLEVNYDDAFAAYINGMEVARSPNLPAGTPDHSTLATSAHEGGEFEVFDLTWLVDDNPWEYVSEYYLNLSVEVHQAEPMDEDMTLAVRLLIDGLPKIHHNSKGYYWPSNFRPPDLVTDPITTIYRPLINIPSIVERGRSFEITCGAPSVTSDWQAQLVSPYTAVDLDLSAATYHATTYRWFLEAEVPAGIPMGLYHLVVTASGGIRDTTAQSVKVIDRPKEDFYFIHLTDTHIPERGGSTLPLFEEVLEEITIINPEFVLISGDYVNRSFKDQIEFGELYLERFQVPVYLTSGNHDIGDGMEPWWDYFGWPYLNTYDSTHWDGGPVTQDYSFDYGNLHVVAPMTWVNYINFQSWIYGYHSMIPSQIAWLHTDLSGLQGDPYIVMFYHYDFGWYDDENPHMPEFFDRYGVDLALWGHTHNAAQYQDGPTLSLNTAAAMNSGGGYRLLKFKNNHLYSHPHLWHSGDITLEYSAPNDGTSPVNTATITNTHNEIFEHALVRFRVPGSDSYLVDGGEVIQTIDAGGDLIYEVEVEVPANGQAEVSIAPQTAIEESKGSARPAEFALHQNSPNPFNGHTSISFTLPGDGHQLVQMKLYNVQGQLVVTLLDQRLKSGRHTVRWNGADAYGYDLASGVYFCRLRVGQKAETVKMLLVR